MIRDIVYIYKIINRISIYLGSVKSRDVVNTDSVLNSYIVNDENRKIGRKGEETAEGERKIIINLYDKCKTLNEISKIVNKPRSTIRGIIDRYGDSEKF